MGSVLIFHAKGGLAIYEYAGLRVFLLFPFQLATLVCISHLKNTNLFRYDYHRGVDIPTPNGTEVYAIDDGIVRLAGKYPNYVEPVVQVSC